MGKGLLAFVAGVGIALSASLGADVGFQEYSSFYSSMNGFFGEKRVSCSRYSVELKRQRHLQLNARDLDTDVKVVDVGSDGFGHNGDRAVCTHKFKDGSVFEMEIVCREDWRYSINSKLFYVNEGTNAVAEAEFDPSTCLKFIPFGERIVKSKVRPVEQYAKVVYTDLVMSSLRGVESRDVPYSVIKDVFYKLENDLHRVKGRRETLGHNLLRNTEEFVVLARQKMKERRN